MRFFIFSLALFTMLKFTYAQDFNILYFNDAHDLEPVIFNHQEVGGIAKVAHLIKEKRTDSTFVFFGGDLAGGTLTGKVFKGTVMVKALNEIGIDAANPGQHEFDYGIENFLSLKKQSNFPWVNSHLKSSNHNSLCLPFLILTKNNKRIGVIGITDKIETSFPSLPILSLDYNTELKKIFKANPNIDFWVAVTQMSLDLNEQLHNDFPEINLILTEETYHDRTQIIWHNNTPIIAVSGNAGDIVEINYKQGIPKLKVHAIRQHSLEDTHLQQWVNDSIQQMNHRLGKKIATASSTFHKEETHMGERAIGNLVADAFRFAYQAQIGIIQGGGIRAGLQKGIITQKNIYEVLPFENDLVLTQLTGSEIKNMLEKAMERLMPQVSGIRVKYSTHNKTYKIEEVYFNHQPIEDSTLYKVSLPSYISDGGGNFKKIAPEKILKRNLKDAEALEIYLQDKKIIHPVMDNRIFKAH